MPGYRNWLLYAELFVLPWYTGQRLLDSHCHRVGLNVSEKGVKGRKKVKKKVSSRLICTSF